MSEVLSLFDYKNKKRLYYLHFYCQVVFCEQEKTILVEKHSGKKKITLTYQYYDANITDWVLRINANDAKLGTTMIEYYDANKCQHWLSITYDEKVKKEFSPTRCL